MKFWEKDNGNYFKIFLAVFLAITCSIMVYFLFSKIKYIWLFIDKLFVILSPVIIGIIIAMLLNPIVKKIEDLFIKNEKIKKKNKLGRVLSILVTYLIVFILIFWLIH